MLTNPLGQGPITSDSETVLVAFHPKAKELRIRIAEFRTWDREVLMDNLAQRHGGTHHCIKIVTESEAKQLVAAGAYRVW